MDKKLDYTQKILEIIKAENKRPIPIGIILKKLSSKDTFINKNVFFRNIQYLKDTCQVVTRRDGKLILGYPKADVDMSQVYTGEIHINAKLTGFITKEGEEDSNYFVHKTNLNGALNGDTVEFGVLKIEQEEGKTLKDARVLKVISHAKGYYVGLYNSDGFNYSVKCDDPKMYLPIKLEDCTGLTNGTKFLFNVVKFTDTEAIAKVAKIIGHISDVGTDILSIVYDNGVEPEFPTDVMDYASKLTEAISEEDRKERVDLTNLDIVTIDPATSKDFDDAIYVKQEGQDLYRLYVCIADVAHYVKPHTCLDDEAIKRGCSIYLVDRVIPMLPHILSDVICSLNPNVERKCLCSEMLIDENGQFKEIKTYPAIMKSHRRFSYDEVNEFFKGNSKLENDADSIKEMLVAARSLHHILTAEKTRRGYIRFDVPEAQIIVNEKCEPIEIKLRQTGEAQDMIENFMVAANEAVTIEALKREMPFVYRVHEAPEAKRVETFKVEAKKLGFKLPSGDIVIEPKSFANWLAINKDCPNLDIVNILMLRTMAKAKYDIKNLGHFGLASVNYTHFTSPIRRYPDVLVHRLYRMFVFDRDKYSDEQRSELVNNLKLYCKKSTEAEIRAVDTERAVNSLKFAQYMSKHIGEEFVGKVSGVTKFGVFVELPNTIEGLIKLALLKDDFYQYDEKNIQLVGKQHHKVFTLGTKLKVKCIGASMADRSVDFELVERL